jgi:hypothetical protein
MLMPGPRRAYTASIERARSLETPQALNEAAAFAGGMLVTGTQTDRGL